MTYQADNTHSPAQAAEPLALRLSEGLGLAPERAVFDRWLRDNGHCEDQHDDMLTPLQRSLNSLMWSAWQAAAQFSRNAQDDAYVCGRNDERKAIAEWLEGQGQPGYAHEVRHRA